MTKNARLMGQRDTTSIEGGKTVALEPNLYGKLETAPVTGFVKATASNVRP